MMDSIPYVFAAYLRYHPDEAARLHRLQHLLAEVQNSEALISRTNFLGHVTASGFVLNAARDRVLLIHHKSLQMYLQPGGHLESTDVSLRDGARREIAEETGITTLTYQPTYTDVTVPFDIDVHYIPARPAKGEPEHWHHDFRYMFICTGETNAVANQTEVSDVAWVELTRLHEFPTLEMVANKLQKQLSGGR